MAEQELDVRRLRKPDKHPAVFQAYEALAVGASFMLVNSHDPKHLHDEFDTDHPRGYGWEYLAEGPQAWRVRIRKLASTPLPRILRDTSSTATDIEPDATGAIWKLQIRQRDLDSNIIHLAAGTCIEAHTGPDLDVLIFVLTGSGQILTELDTLDLHLGALVWLPRRSNRQIVAGSNGLNYLTVHQRRQSLALASSTRPDNDDR